jgi:hypothetical protein
VGGQYVLRSWINDVYAPKASLVTRRVAAGRPTLVVRVHDPEPRPHTMSGIDPTSLVLAYRGVARCTAYDPRAVGRVRDPGGGRRCPRATPAIVVAADYQESKTSSRPAARPPNTVSAPSAFAARRRRLRGSSRPRARPAHRVDARRRRASAGQDQLGSS